MKEEAPKQERTIEDYKKWFLDESSRNADLVEEIKRLKEIVKAQAIYISSL